MTKRSKKNSIELPDSIDATLEADASPLKGGLLLVTLHVTYKNAFNSIGGPSHKDGKVTISRAQLEQDAERDANAFPADYAGLSAFNGHITLMPMSCKEIEAALAAYDLYSRAISYPSFFRSVLEHAWAKLYQLAPKRLSVTVDSQAQYSGVRICTMDILA
jgi:hypothetical protein